MKIIADDKIPFLEGVLEPFAQVIYLPGGEISRNDLMDADALLIRTRTKCNSGLLAGTPVKFIGTATIGYDHIDTSWCVSNGIHWTNAPGCNSWSVHQYVTAALFHISEHEGINLRDKTLGIIGVGNVGSKVEKTARLLGINVLLNDPPRERSEGKGNFTDFNKVISESDIVTVHVPLNPDGADKTFHLLENEVLGRMKAGSWLINTSRGEVVETRALKKVLSDRSISGAVLDVWENEPCIDTELMGLTYISTPHIAGYSTDGKAKGTSMVVNALSEFLNLPLNKWYPSELPAPVNNIIRIDCSGKTDEEIIGNAVLHTYNLISDSDRLRNSPAEFEKFRGNYPLRREFGAYCVELLNSSAGTASRLERLGFCV